MDKLEAQINEDIQTLIDSTDDENLIHTAKYIMNRNKIGALLREVASLERENRENPFSSHGFDSDKYLQILNDKIKEIRESKEEK